MRLDRNEISMDEGVLIACYGNEPVKPFVPILLEAKLLDGLDQDRPET